MISTDEFRKSCKAHAAKAIQVGDGLRGVRPEAVECG